MTMRNAVRFFLRRPRRKPICVTRTVYVVRHPRLAVYWRDPYKRYKNAGDPRSDWSARLDRAYRFAEQHHAQQALREANEEGLIVATSR